MLQPPPATNITIITANQRLSTYLRKQYDTLCQIQGLTTWPTLDCLPLTRWLQRLFDTLLDQRLILSEIQELAVWENIIAAALEHNGQDFLLLRPYETAQTARDAWHLLKQWRLPLTLLHNSPSEDIQHFMQWAQTFANHCQTQHWITSTDCADIIEQALQKQIINLPQHLLFSGFEEISPQIFQLCKALTSLCKIHWHPPGVSLEEMLSAIQLGKNSKHITAAAKTPAAVISISLLDKNHEIRTMALWAKQQLQQNPGITIGCVIPELNTLRSLVERIFTDTFTPDLNTERTTLPFNLSAGVALSQYPLIRTAFSILQLAHTELSIEHISGLLRSPFIGAEPQEQSARAVLDIILRQAGERFLNLQHLIKLSQHAGYCPQWTKQLMAFLGLIQGSIHASKDTKLPNTNIRQLPSAWTPYFIELLQALGWPGERSLNSTEFQQLQRWQNLLSEFSTLDLTVHKPITFASALNRLRQLAQHTLFQPQSADVPIQVLGLLEASGIQFARLWVMGMNDEYWPSPPAANPFIPISVQRQHNMPHASAERELAFSQKLTARFSLSADLVIFSYSQREGDMPLAKSSLINHLEEIPLSALVPPIPQHVPDPSRLEYFQDDLAPPIAISEPIRGGANILKHQSICPFRAFAKIRLGATKLPDLVSGLSPQERGILLHEALEQVWTTLDNHDSLLNYDPDKLIQLVRKTVTAVLQQKAKHRPFSLKPRFIHVEGERLTQLVLDWLELEKQRPFFRVVQREFTQQINFAGLNLVLRVDREDELADGSRVIIDYKTGLPRIDHWFGERPEDPQLPLYCLTSAHPITGLLFAQVRNGQSQFKGVSAVETGIAGVKPVTQLEQEYNTDWRTFQQQQRKILEQLVMDFLRGNALVDPKNGADTCRTCELQMLCRVHESM